jgi:hypothetical protein
MNELVRFLDELSTKIPGSKQANELIASQPQYLKDMINTNESRVIKQSISKNELYADMTQITLY